MIPVRCFTCNKVVANKYNTYLALQKEGMDNKEIFEKIGFTRYCCKRMFLGNIDDDDKLLTFPRIIDHVTLHDKVDTRVYLAR